MTRAMRLLFPDALAPASLFEGAGVSPSAIVHPSARLESDVIVDPGAVIGPFAEIGSGSIVGPHPRNWTQGQNRAELPYGAQATITHATLAMISSFIPARGWGKMGSAFLSTPGGI